MPVRPTLIVGVGGTGCLAVKQVKRRLMELSEGHEVPFVAFAVIDTTTQEPSGEPLNDGEFINIGNVDFNDIVRNLSDYPHLEKWFPSKSFKPMQLGFGAMGMRQIGRLCYFQWRETSRVLETFRSRIQQLMDPMLVDRTSRMEGLFNFQLEQSLGLSIHIIGSGAGGTGSGIMLDLAYDLRRLALDEAGTVQLSGHVLLPDAFEELIPRHILGQAYNNSHALLAELDHFIATGDWDVGYKGGQVKFERQAPFDLIYLLNRGGSENGIRTREQITAMIGAMIAAITFTRTGKHIQDSAVNLLTNVLSGSDPISGRPRAYNSYGIAIGTTDRAEILEQTTFALQQQLVDAMLDGTPEMRSWVHEEAAAWWKDSGFVDHDLHGSIQPDVPDATQLPGTSGKALIDQIKNPQQYKLEDKTREFEQLWQEKMRPRLKRLDPPEVAKTLAELLKKASPMPDGARGLSLPALKWFIQAARDRIRASEMHCQDQASACSKRSANEKIELERYSQGQGNLQPPDRKKLFTHLRDRDENDQRAKAYAWLASKLQNAERQLGETLASLIEDLERDGRLLRDRLREPALTETTAPKIRLFEGKPILKALRIDQELITADQDLRSRLSRAFLKENSHLRLEAELPKSIHDIAKSTVERALEIYSPGGRLDPAALTNAMEKADRTYLQNRLTILHRCAQPALRCVERLARESAVHVGRLGAHSQSAALQHLAALDPSVQGGDDLCRDLPLINFVLGVPLWAINGVEKWEQAALDTQTDQGVWHNYIDPRLANEISSHTRGRELHRKLVYLFSLLWLKKQITVENGLYRFETDDAMNGEAFTRERPRWRSNAFEIFRRLCRNGRGPFFVAADHAVESVLQGLPMAEQRTQLEEHRSELTRMLEKQLGSNLDLSAPDRQKFRADVTLLREEIAVIDAEVRRKRLDEDLHG